MDIPEEELLPRLQHLDPYAFEYLVADVWEQMGWRTEVTEQSKDGGIDIIARKEMPFRRKHYIQAKRYSSRNKIRPDTVRECASLLLKNNPNRDQQDAAVLVTTATLTNQAQSEAEEFNLKIVDGDKIARLLVEWDLSEITRDYLRLEKADQGPESRYAEIEDLSPEDYQDSSQWANLDEFNEVVDSEFDEDFEATVMLDGDTLYKLTHGEYRTGELNDRVNIHSFKNPTSEQREKLRRISEDLGMKYLPKRGEEDVWMIFDRVEENGRIETLRTVQIGSKIANRVYGHPFSDVDIEITTI